MDKEQNPSQDNLRYESDTARLVRLHLSDPNHVFTEEELASIRVGSTPIPELPSGESFEDEDNPADKKGDDDSQPMSTARSSKAQDTLD